MKYSLGIFNILDEIGTIKDRNSMDIRRGDKNTQKNYTKKILMTWITMMV